MVGCFLFIFHCLCFSSLPGMEMAGRSSQLSCWNRSQQGLFLSIALPQFPVQTRLTIGGSRVSEE